MSPTLQRILIYAAILAVAGGMIALNHFQPHLYLPAILWVVLSRLLYVGYVGYVLCTERQAPGEPAERIEARYARFRRLSWLTMHHDAAAQVVLAYVTRGTMPLDQYIPTWAVYVAAVVMIAIGHGFKMWASATIGDGGYFWRDAFFPPTGTAPSAAGPYRYIKNPMYTIGYLHAYALAVFFQSWYSLCAAVYVQAAILIFLRLFEKPNFDRIYSKAAAPATLPPVPAPAATGGGS
jgi:protein-S-isoprenylcysteine O-methyltransferase Ste14